MSQNNPMKKIITHTILCLVMGAAILLPIRSYAIFGLGDIVSDFGVIPEEVVQTIGQVEQIVNQVKSMLKEFGLDVVIYKVSQQMSQKLLNKVLNKANGGGDKADAKLFVENFGKYFQDISKQQLGAFTDQLSNSTSPFAQSISMGISNRAGGDTDASKSLLESFSLGDTLPDSVKWQDAAKDISLAGSQGWDFYGSLALPQNTPMGVGIIAQDELAKKIESTKETAKTELTSSGFKPDKEKSGLGSMFQNNGQESFSNVNTDGDIKTPSKTNEDQSGQAVIETFDRLRNADSFGKIIFNTIQQMITGLVQKGFSSLNSDGGGKQKFYGGPRDVTKIINSSNGSWTNVPQQVVDLRNNLDTSIEKTSLEIKYLEQTVDSVKKPVSDSSSFSDGYNNVTGTILSLEVCIPGYDTGAHKRLLDYMQLQLKDTQERSGKDNNKGTKNSNAMTQVRQEVDQAIAESRALESNPFLNIPAAQAMKSILTDYYKNARKFRGLINTLVIKRQTLNNLQVLRSQAQLVGTTANNNVPLMLFDAQWNDPAMTQAKKTALYNSLKSVIASSFPEYLVETADIKNVIDVTSTQTSGTVTLKALATDDPTTPDINERDEDMKKRIFNEQWNEWETKVANADKQKIYSRFIGLTQDISDSNTVQNAQILAESTADQYEELKQILDDCKNIRSHLIANPNASSNDPTFINTLKSERIRVAYPGPSILNAAANGIDFAKLNEKVVGDLNESYGLQVPQLPKTATEVINQDIQSSLFCRLTNYELFYWAPKDLTGKPIGCGRGRPKFTKVAASPNYIFTGTDLIGISAPDGDSTSGAAEEVKPTWYHTNNAEILFLVSDY